MLKWRFDIRSARLVLAAVLFAILTLIALFVHDSIIRPYGGDFLVVIFLYLLVRGFTRLDRWPSAALVFAFACAVELAQAVHLVALLGLSRNAAARVVVGMHADLRDIALYAAGVMCAALLDRER